MQLSRIFLNTLFLHVTMKMFSFGQVIPGLVIDGQPATYPVLNERDARAAAGIMLVGGIVAFVNALLLSNLMYLYVFIILFSIEFAIRVVINPYYAPFYALGRLLVYNQRPDWSGAPQKRFAWSLGLGLALFMSVAVFGFGVTGLLPFAICSICLSLLWLESALGVCVGCKMYFGLMNLGVISRPAVMPACPGGVCDIRKQ